MKANRFFWKRVLGMVLAAAAAASVAGCGSGSSGESKAESSGPETSSTAASTPAKSGKSIVNIGVTDTLGTLNPFAIDQTEINKYSTAMMFLPLVELNEKMEFESALAESITVKDNKVFTIHVSKDAKWSDGKPVTSDDVAFTITRLCSPVIANPTLQMSAFEGTNDDGFIAKGADTFSGLKVLDDKTLTLTTKSPMSLVTFENTYARYIMTVPKHILGTVSEEALAKDPWFNKPTVVDGPYQATAVDTNHYISYDANPNYWKGTPKIPKMNIKIVSADQILSGLKSGEIDFVQPTMAATPQEDQAGIEKLENVSVVYSDPVTTQSMFLNTKNIPDPKVRKAILYAIDRKMLLQNLLNGKGEIDDGFVTSVSPYFDKSIQATEYSPDKAKSLLEQAGWDSGKTLTWYINSGDSTFVNGSNVIKEELKAVGINVDIRTVDLTTLMEKASSQAFDLMTVQYTYAPVDQYPDIQWLLGGKGSWTNFSSDEMNSALSKTQTSQSADELKQQYTAIDKIVQDQCPMINLYVIRSFGAVGKSLKNAHPNVYGSFTNIQDWEFQ